MKKKCKHHLSKKFFMSRSQILKRDFCSFYSLIILCGAWEKWNGQNKLMSQNSKPKLSSQLHCFTHCIHYVVSPQCPISCSQYFLENISTNMLPLISFKQSKVILLLSQQLEWGGFNKITGMRCVLLMWWIEHYSCGILLTMNRSGLKLPNMMEKHRDICLW